MPVPAVLGFVVNVVSNAAVGFPMVITRLSTFMWAIKFAETLSPAVVIDAQNDAAQRKILEDWILDNYMRDRGYDISWAIPGMQSVVDPICNNQWHEATTTQQRDPLAIDLDSDGIETSGIPATGNPILFDHDADGIETTPVVVNGVPTLFDHDADGVLTGTGWLRPDDAWLVRDLNGNGSFDSGRELFGVDTLITVTQTVNGQQQTVTRNATNGFEALQGLDTGNGAAGSAGFSDRVLNASDAQFANVRVWRVCLTLAADHLSGFRQ